MGTEANIRDFTDCKTYSGYDFFSFVDSVHVYTAESRCLEPSIFRTSRQLEPKVVSLSSIEHCNFTTRFHRSTKFCEPSSVSHGGLKIRGSTVTFDVYLL